MGTSRNTSVVDRLVGRGPEIEIDVRSPGGIPDALGHQDPDQVLLRVRIPGRTIAAVPAEPSGDRPHIVTPGDHDMPKPQPRLSQKPGKKSETAFCSGVMWSVVISSTESLDRMRSRPCFPLFSIIRPKARKSSTVETSPPPPDSKTGRRVHRPPRASSKTVSPPVAGSVW
jgi:hypothetical protein